MYTSTGEEVYSFSQLRNEYADVETFYLDTGVRPISPVSVVAGSPVLRRSRSSNGIMAPVVQNDASQIHMRQRARSKSRPRTLYAADSDAARSNGIGEDLHTNFEHSRIWMRHLTQNVRFPFLFAADYSSSDYVKEEPIKMNIRGIRRTFYPPAQQTQIDNSPPDKKLQLKWVHGYRGRDTHKNLWVLPSGELLYYVAAIAVLYDRDEETQRHYTGHTEDIMRLMNQFFFSRRYLLPLWHKTYREHFIFLFSAWTFIHHVNWSHQDNELAAIVNRKHM